MGRPYAISYKYIMNIENLYLHNSEKIKVIQ